MGKTDLDIADKAIENIKTFLKVATGEEEFSFACEKISADLQQNILLNKKFLKPKLDQIDSECANDANRSKDFVMEHIENYANQRSLNYAYSERKRLFQVGWDSKLGEEYRAGLTKNTINKLKEREEKP